MKVYGKPITKDCTFADIEEMHDKVQKALLTHAGNGTLNSFLNPSHKEIYLKKKEPKLLMSALNLLHLQENTLVHFAIRSEHVCCESYS